jgi:wyosine [tRNA(Phe)-imidazoG37] synthetase (radical SAM superfamily)
MNPGGSAYAYGPVPSRRLGRSLGINSSLLGRAEVRETLRMADWVSLKVDAVRRFKERVEGMT